MTTDVLPTRADLHLARRIWHFGAVLVMFALYWFMTKEDASKLALFVTLFLVGLDLSRLYLPHLNRLLIPLFKPVLRTHETHRPTAATFLLIGTTICIFIFSKPIMLLTLLMLALADPLAAVVGTRYGKDKLIGRKSLQGSIAAFIVCFFVSLIYFYTLHFFTDRLLLVSLLCGLIGALSELIPVFNWDDNFTFPILCSTSLAGLFYLFGAINVF